jgi:hypothetical protein
MEDREQIPPDELTDEDAELLPDREAMSIITPGLDRPLPLDPAEVPYNPDVGAPYE